MLNNYTRAALVGVVIGVALLALTGCAKSGTADTTMAQHTADANGSIAAAVSIDAAWVKSAEPGGMTAAFGTLTNASAIDVNLVSVSSSASPLMQLHETVPNESGQMVMREVEGGFVIPANDDLHLEPAGYHIMIMDLEQALNPGEDVTFTLGFSDGSTLDFTAIVKDYAGANENYEGSHGDHGDH